MKIGFNIAGDLATIAALASRAEAAGLESVWVAELDRSAFIQAAAAMTATSRIGVGTAVALAFPRSPTITAMTAWDLDELSGNRFLLGLGPQVPRVLEGRFSIRVEHPAPQLAEYVAALRTVWAANRGEQVSHDGTAYRITMPTFHGPLRPERRDPPVLLAAVGPILSRVCGEVADGLVGHPLASPRYLAEAIAPAVAAGLERAERPAGACPISAMVLVSIGDDPDAARLAAKRQLGFYATTPSYRHILDLHGRGHLGREFRRAFGTGDRERLASLVDDELLDAIAIAGRPDEAADRLRAWDGVAERAIISAPWYGLTPAQEHAAQEAAFDLAARLSSPGPARAAPAATPPASVSPAAT